MKKSYNLLTLVSAIILLLFAQCTSKKMDTGNSSAASSDFHGYKSQAEWGEHLVKVSGCHDCHTPKMMTPAGPVPDTSLLLSGHPEKMPAPVVDRKDIERKGFAVTSTLTAWVGPWGISYAANITSDATGIGNWQESNFIRAIREGKFKGLPGSRTLLPPMPWQYYRYMTDEEIKAIFAYLKTTKPVHNIVPASEPPVLAVK